MLQKIGSTATSKSLFVGSAVGGILILVAQAVRRYELAAKICAVIGCGIVSSLPS